MDERIVMQPFWVGTAQFILGVIALLLMIIRILNAREAYRKGLS
jgi:uncharacterized membrane protein